MKVDRRRKRKICLDRQTSRSDSATSGRPVRLSGNKKRSEYEHWWPDCLLLLQTRLLDVEMSLRLQERGKADREMAPEGRQQRLLNAQSLERWIA